MPHRTLEKDGSTSEGYAQREVCDALHTASASGTKAPLIAFGAKGCGMDVQHDIAPALRAMNFDKSHPNGGGQIAVAFKPGYYTRGKDGGPAEITPPLTADADKGDQEAIVFQARIARNGRGQPEAICPALNGSDAGATSDMRPLLALPAGGPEYRVRRLLPVECERLQGFRDGHTAVPDGNKPMADSARYRQLGNSMPVPMIQWVGRRIMAEVGNA
jgi:DNA (cytosine-5)-methyltransferase 1